MPLSRRKAVRAAAGLPVIAGVGGLLARPALAQQGAPATETTLEQPPAFFRFRLGDAIVTTFSDGNLFLSPAVNAANAPEGEVKALLRRHYLPLEQAAVQTTPTLIETGGRRVLVDVGSGHGFQDTAGRLSANMAAAGVAAETIDLVVITHAHPDHCWGLLNPLGEVRYPRAEVVIGEAEWNWWMKEGRANEVPEGMRPFVLGAQRHLGAVAERTRRVKDGAEVVPGLRMVAAPGHTLGHMILYLESGNERLVLAADTFSHHVLSLAHPEWHSAFDMDGGQASATRRRILDMLATDRLKVVGFHMPWPGVGHVGREGDGYRWHPETFVWG